MRIQVPMLVILLGLNFPLIVSATETRNKSEQHHDKQSRPANVKNNDVSRNGNAANSCAENGKHDANSNVIGTATMQQDGTIELDLAAEAPGGGRGHLFDVVAPNDPRYHDILKKLCGIKRGQKMSVYEDTF